MATAAAPDRQCYAGLPHASAEALLTHRGRRAGLSLGDAPAVGWRGREAALTGGTCPAALAVPREAAAGVLRQLARDRCAEVARATQQRDRPRPEGVDDRQLLGCDRRTGELVAKALPGLRAVDGPLRGI